MQFLVPIGLLNKQHSEQGCNKQREKKTIEKLKILIYRIKYK